MTYIKTIKNRRVVLNKACNGDAVFVLYEDNADECDLLANMELALKFCKRYKHIVVDRKKEEWNSKKLNHEELIAFYKRDIKIYLQRQARKKSVTQ
jgi:hypothetical protein